MKVLIFKRDIWEECIYSTISGYSIRFFWGGGWHCSKLGTNVIAVYNYDV